MMRVSDRERLFSNLLIQPDGCVTWQRSRNHKGYGQIWLEGRMQRVHRVMYEIFAGPVPDGLQIDHLCRNKTCANVAHLEPVTALENMRRSMPDRRQYDRSACPAGHPYDEANTYHHPDGDRRCRACHRDQQRRYKRAGESNSR